MMHRDSERMLVESNLKSTYEMFYRGVGKNGTKNASKVVPFFPTLSHFFQHCPILSNTSRNSIWRIKLILCGKTLDKTESVSVSRYIVCTTTEIWLKFPPNLRLTRDKGPDHLEKKVQIIEIKGELNQGQILSWNSLFVDWVNGRSYWTSWS